MNTTIAFLLSNVRARTSTDAHAHAAKRYKTDNEPNGRTTNTLGRGSGKGAGCDKMCAYTGLLLFRFKTISTDVVVNFAMASPNDESDEGFSCISIIERQELCRCDKDPPTLTHWIGLMKHFLRFQRLRRIWSYLGSHLKDREAIGRGQLGDRIA